MKLSRLILTFNMIWLFVFALSAQLAWGQANEALGSEPMVSQETAASVQLQAVSETAFERVQVGQTSGLDVAIALKKRTYNVPSPDLDEMQVKIFEQMSPNDKDKFLEKRRWMLSKLAQLLNSTRLGLGVGSAIKHRISQIIPSKSLLIHPIETIQNWHKERRSGVVRSRHKPSSEKIIEGILSAVDQLLWSQSQMVAQSNEMGFTASMGLIGEAGARSRGLGGIASLGFAVGFNREAESMVFEFIKETEKFESSPTMVFSVGLFPRMGVYFRHIMTDNPAKLIQGKSFYPPIAPAYLTIQDNYSSLGTNLGFFCFPPTPFAEMMGYTNRSRRSTLFRSPSSRKAAACSPDQAAEQIAEVVQLVVEEKPSSLVTDSALSCDRILTGS